MPVTGEPGHYTWTWDNTAVPTGIYTIEAFAYSSGKQQGNSVSLAITVEVTTPPAPTNLAGVPSDGQVQLTWDTYTITDFLPVGAGDIRQRDDVGLAGSESDLAAYPHSGLMNGTDHYYRVRVWTRTATPAPGRRSAGPFSPPCRATPSHPSVPGGFAVAQVAGKQNIHARLDAVDRRRHADHGRPGLQRRAQRRGRRPLVADPQRHGLRAGPARRHQRRLVDHVVLPRPGRRLRRQRLGVHGRCCRRPPTRSPSTT